MMLEAVKPLGEGVDLGLNISNAEIDRASEELGNGLTRCMASRCLCYARLLIKKTYLNNQNIVSVQIFDRKLSGDSYYFM